MPEIFQREAILQKADKPNTYRFLASSEKEDSYGDVVVQKGIDLSRFKANPIILYQHNSDEPIGKAVQTKLGDKGMEVDIELAPKGISEKIDTIRGLIEAGILKAVSIGFSPIEYEPIRNKDNQFTGYKFIKSLLHEISVVSIPANDEALAIAKSYNLPQRKYAELFSNAKSLEQQQINRNKLALQKAKHFNRTR